MSEKDIHLPASDDAVDAILAEVLGNEGSHMVKKYSNEGAAITSPQPEETEEPAVQPPQAPPVATPKNTAGTTYNTTHNGGYESAGEVNPELIGEDYRAAAARYEVNGYRISAPQAPGYAPYAPYPAYPAYPAYPQPYAYMPYPAYPTYPAYPQPYGYAPYPAGYEAYGEYPTDQQQPQQTPEQQSGQNAYAAAAGSRVVYDADWANGTPPQQQPQQPQQPAVPVMQQSQSGKPHVNPAFIDPLSADDDETVPSAYVDGVSFADRRKSKTPPQTPAKSEGTDFFPAGFSATKNNTVVANGKTAPNVSAAADGERESVLAGFSEDYEKTANRRQEWMMTDEEVQELREKRRREAAEALLQLTQEINSDSVEAPKEPDPMQDEQSQRKAEAQQIIAERFSQAAASENPYVSDTVQEEYASQDEESDMSETEDIDPYGAFYDDYESKGENELYYNNPNENENTAAQEKDKKQKKGGKFAAFIRRNVPHKGQTKREFISCLIMDLAFVVLIGGLIFCGIYLKNYQDTRNREKEIENIVEPGLADRLTDVELEEWWKEIRAAYPDVDFPEGFNPDLAQLYAVNQDVAGWLEIEGVDLSNVILQADDNDYYLYRDLYKESTKYGNPFVDYRNSMNSTTLSRNTIIYGHNTHDGLKFYNLTRYLELSGYRNAPIVKLNTLFNGMTYWKVFAVTLSDSTTDEFEYLYTSFSSESSFLNLIDDIRAHSMFDIDVDVVAGDNILTLYTCYQNLFEDGRLTVFARQVRAGEDLTVNTANASVNSDCLYPDAYYGITYENSTSPVSSGNSSDSTLPASSDDPTEEDDYGSSDEEPTSDEEDYGYEENDYGSEDDYNYEDSNEDDYNYEDDYDYGNEEDEDNEDDNNSVG